MNNRGSGHGDKRVKTLLLQGKSARVVDVVGPVKTTAEQEPLLQLPTRVPALLKIEKAPAVRKHPEARPKEVYSFDGIE